MEEKKTTQETELQKHARLNNQREQKLADLRRNNERKMFLISTLIAWIAGALQIVSSYVNNGGKTDFYIGVAFICIGFVFCFMSFRVGKKKK